MCPDCLRWAAIEIDRGSPSRNGRGGDLELVRRGRFWAVYESGRLLCIAVYRKGAEAVAARFRVGQQVRRAVEAAELRAALRSFTGTEEYHAHWSRARVFTDGVKFLADAAGAYWLIDLIASWQRVALQDGWLREFQLWELHVREDRSALVVCSRDSEGVAFTQEVEFTDFPLEYAKLYVEERVLLLPSEH